ncbi:MAG: hypothetical protein ACQEXJ_06285 [Myxococcota bacterium]
MQNAAESHLEGDVGPATTGGVIRYRIWPVRRHPMRTIVAALVPVGLAVATWLAFRSPLWATFVFLGAVAGLAPFFFPTDVTLDGHSLHIRQLGTPRIWDLRSFRRIEMCGEPLPRAELTSRARFTPLDSVDAVVVPMPDDPVDREVVVLHLRRWVGRQPTGRFEIDADHAPEDNVGDEAD